MVEEKKSKNLPALAAVRQAGRQGKKDYIAAIGRRREAIARVRLYSTPGADLMFGGVSVSKGDILVNQIPADKYFSTPVAKVSLIEPFRVTNTIGRFAVTVKVTGGGKSGQLDAFIHGVSRALSFFDSEKYRKILKKKGFLTRDPRTRERRKVGTGGKARRKKQSPKR